MASPERKSLLDERLITALRSKKAFLCTVESCTGGLIAHRVTAISGSSDVFWGGFVVYDNSAKHSMVSVPAEVIAKNGAVSEPVARLLAEGGLARMRKEISGRPAAERFFCVATTGIAGPTGGTAQKPVGLCYIAVAASDGLPAVTREIRTVSNLSRSENKAEFAERAIELLLSRISG